MTHGRWEPDMGEFHLETVGPIGDCAVLQVTGEVDVYTAPLLREQIRDLAAKGAVHLIADLDRVDFLDSTAWEPSSAASDGSARPADRSHWPSAPRASCASSR